MTEQHEDFESTHCEDSVLQFPETLTFLSKLMSDNDGISSSTFLSTKVLEEGSVSKALTVQA